MAVDSYQNGITRNRPFLSSIIYPSQWFKPQYLHPQVEHLIYWRNVRQTATVFGFGVTIIFAVACFSVISVLAWLALILLLGGMAIRVYKNFLQMMQKTVTKHPFEDVFDSCMNITPEKAEKAASSAVGYLNAMLFEMRSLFLVEEVFKSLKFGCFLWTMTNVGAWFNGLTIVLIFYVMIFTLPKLYESKKDLALMFIHFGRQKLSDAYEKMRKALPFGGMNGPGHDYEKTFIIEAGEDD